MRRFGVEEVRETTNPSGTDSEDDAFGLTPREDALELWEAFRSKYQLGERTPTPIELFLYKMQYREHRRQLRQQFRLGKRCAHHEGDPRRNCGTKGKVCKCRNYFCPTHMGRHRREQCPASEHFQMGASLLGI